MRQCRIRRVTEIVADDDVVARTGTHHEIRAVVVACWSASTIEDCLSRLLAATHVVEVVVIDNGSGDNTVEIVEHMSMNEPRLALQRNPDNPGFAVACNQGAKDCAQSWLAFVNPDCLVEPDTFARLLAHAESTPATESVSNPGVLGCEQIDANGARDPAVRRRDVSLRALLFARGRRDAIEIPSDGSALQRVDAISGALMLLPSVVFDVVGGFDEAYRLHAEDLDLCRRVRAAGHAVAVANAVVVTHLRGVSSRRWPLWVEWQKHRSVWRYFRKFEAIQTPAFLKPILWLGLWMHFMLALPRLWLQAR